MMDKLELYFSFESEVFLEETDIYDLLNETSILEAENLLQEKGVDVSNIYFKLLAQTLYTEKTSSENRSLIAYMYYLLGYYVGLFLHPFNGNSVAMFYLDEAISKETNALNIAKYHETKKMILEEM